MTEPTIDERIENMRKEGQTFSATGHRGRALAIIDELRTKHDDFRQQCADLADDALSIIYELRAENARLLETMKFQEKQYLAEHGHWGECKYKVENARLKESLSRVSVIPPFSSSTGSHIRNCDCQDCMAGL